jgi:uncharacterized protein (TIGR02145 family)/uncharacterized repeat protein (TIGR02059 family)
VRANIENATPTLLEMNYDISLANIVPAKSAFTVIVNSVSRTVNSVAISGTKVQLTLASAIVYGDVVTVSYTKPASNPLQTVSGGQAVSITAQNVTNNINAPVPVYISAVVENATPTLLEMTYSLPLISNGIVPSAFTVMVNSVARVVTAVTINSIKVQLTLASAVAYGDVVTAAYTKPATNPLQTASGGLAVSITAQSVTNNVNQNTITDIEGNGYNTIAIGTQTWMKENLKTTKYKDGTEIPLATDYTIWGNLSTAGYCWYNNDAVTYKNTYGALYNWYTVNTGNLCPLGWHVPNDTEWTILIIYLGGDIEASKKLKEAGTTHWASPNTGATNETSFTAIPGGARNRFGGFALIGYYGDWWSSTEYSTTDAWNRGMGFDTNNVGRVSNDKKTGFSVRCVKD